MGPSRIIRRIALTAAVTIAALVAAVVGAGSPPAGAAAPYQRSLALKLTDRHVGRISATVNGPAGTTVEVEEQTATGTVDVGQLLLPGSGSATLASAGTWLCAPRLRKFIVTTLPAGSGSPTSAMITTPSCHGRLALRAPRAALVDAPITTVIRDRWRIGGISFQLCLTPPGGVRTCSRRRLADGKSRAAVSFRAPRIGGWRLSAGVPVAPARGELVWVSHPGGVIRLLAAGDSEMQILDTDIAQDLSRYRVKVTSDARPSTGLENEWFFNWHTEAAKDAASARPDITVFYMGANGGFAINTSHGLVQCCSAQWSRLYAIPVEQITRTLLRRNAGRVYWFVMPTPRASSWEEIFDGVNEGIRDAVAQFPGRAGLIDANGYFTPGNHYRNVMLYHGQPLVIHIADGVHITAAADTAAATLVVHQLRADRIIR